ncbi:MAG: protein TolR [Rickettsiales bacterium]|nr:protein TolR [Rickettsiales bacterium]MCA0254026.1 protein TolR [Pseudomonadota bacterium]
MGASIQTRSSGRRRRLVNEINVTPMVDVMLVLLIIFMITSPMLVAGVEVDLPQTESAPVSGDSKPLVVSIKKNGDLYLFETLVKSEDLTDKLKEVSKENKDTRIFVKGDKAVAYGKIVETMATIQNAGFAKVALVSDIKQNK